MEQEGSSAQAGTLVAETGNDVAGRRFDDGADWQGALTGAD